MTGFQLNKGFLAGVGVAEVVSAEGEAVDAAVVFLDLASLAGEAVAVAAGVGVVGDTAFRVWGFVGEGDNAPAGVALGVAALRLRWGAGEGDDVLAGVGLVAAAAFFSARCLAGEGDAEGVGV